MILLLNNVKFPFSPFIGSFNHKVDDKKLSILFPNLCAPIQHFIIFFKFYSFKIHIYSCLSPFSFIWICRLFQERQTNIYLELLFCFWFYRKLLNYWIIFVDNLRILIFKLFNSNIKMFAILILLKLILLVTFLLVYLMICKNFKFLFKIIHYLINFWNPLINFIFELLLILTLFL